MKITSNQSIRQTVCLLLADVLLFCTTDVSKVPSFVVIIGFGLLSLTLYQLVRGLLRLGRLYGVTIKRQRSLAVYLTLITAGLIALQSIGELNRRDLTVLLPLSILGYFYSAYLKTSQRNLSS